MKDLKKKDAAPTREHLHIVAMDLEAQGVAHGSDGKVVFVDGALVFEEVSAQIHRVKSSFEKGLLITLHRESAQRVRPRCPHFGLHDGACGGCKMQHLHPYAQVAVKQRVLEDNFWHIAKVRPQQLLRPIEGPAWGYRYRARLSVRHVRKKGTVLVGFHERKSHFVADMRQCPILAPAIEQLLVALRGLIASLDAVEHCPQIEVALGEGPQPVCALVLRHLQDLSAADLHRLRLFAQQHPSLQWWLQSKGPDSVRRLDDADQRALIYTLPDFGLVMPFRPTDFTQVNPFINRVLVSRAVQLLAATRTERVIDWFCGLGNFTLPLATCAGAVLGVEGAEALVLRAQENYASNKALALDGIEFGATTFVARNLFAMTPELLQADGMADKWLIDPPREGAFALVRALADLCVRYQDGSLSGHASPGWRPPQRIVYVSCNPATLARDAQTLVQEAGYVCRAAAVVNMFAHTAHVESLAVFERP